jgi:hypothetical protein
MKSRRSFMPFPFVLTLGSGVCFARLFRGNTDLLFSFRVPLFCLLRTLLLCVTFWGGSAKAQKGMRWILPLHILFRRGRRQQYPLIWFDTYRSDLIDLRLFPAASFFWDDTSKRSFAFCSKGPSSSSYYCSKLCTRSLGIALLLVVLFVIFGSLSPTARSINENALAGTGLL